MKHFDHKLFSLAVPLCLLLVAGCASTARGQKQSIYQAQESIQLKDSGQSSADASVIIRYPAIIDRDAEVEFFDAFVAHPIGGSMKEPDSNSDRVAEAIVAKSNYFAMSLFRELKALLPENSVLLSPHIILKDENGRLTSEPLLATENVPSVLTIDFGIYSFPDTSKLMDAPPLAVITVPEIVRPDPASK